MCSENRKDTEREKFENVRDRDREISRESEDQLI